MSQTNPLDPSDPGLCRTCSYGRCQESAKGSQFWRCGRAEVDEAWPRYPRLPVLRCKGFEAQAGED